MKEKLKDLLNTMSRIDILPIEQIAKLMVYPVTTKTKIKFHSPVGLFESLEDGIAATINWLEESVE